MKNLAVVEKVFAFALGDLSMKRSVCRLLYGDTQDKKMDNSDPGSSLQSLFSHLIQARYLWSRGSSLPTIDYLSLELPSIKI